MKRILSIPFKDGLNRLQSALLAIIVLAAFGSWLDHQSGHLPTGTPRQYDSKGFPFISTPTKGSLIVSTGEYNTIMLDTNQHQAYYISSVGTLMTGAWNGIHIACAGPHNNALVTLGDTLYVNGDNTYGQLGQGSTSTISGFVAVTRDSTGAAWPGSGRTIVQVWEGGTSTGWNIWVVLSDGTLWAWGALDQDDRGITGYKGSSMTTYPVKIPFPTGTFINEVVSNDGVAAKDTAGNIWTWGGQNGSDLCINLLGRGASADGTTPTKITLPARATTLVANGADVFLVYCSDTHLYGWGKYLGYLGIGPPDSVRNYLYGFETPYGGKNTPALLDSALNLPHAVMVNPDGTAKIYGNSGMFYYILSNGDMWCNGDKANGLGGDGIELPYSSSTYYWVWPQGTGLCYIGNANVSGKFGQWKPTQVAPGMKFKTFFGSTALDYYAYAVDSSDNMVSWGRGKSGCLADLIQACDAVAGNTNSQRPNWADRPWVTQVDLTAIFGTTTYSAYAAYWILFPSGAPCTIPSAATVSPLLTVTTSGSNITLDPSGSTNSKSYYWWNLFTYQVSGPAMNLPLHTFRSAYTVSGLANGTYGFRVQATDIRFDSASSVTVYITVGASTLPPSNAIKVRRVKFFKYSNH